MRISDWSSDVCSSDLDGGFTVYGAAPDGGWTEHASGRIEAESGPPPPSLDLAAERARLAADPDGPQALFEMLDGRGIALGPSFRGLHAIWRGDGEALAEVVVPEALVETAAGLPIPPAVLASCFQLLDRQSVVAGTLVSVRLERVGRRF